MDIVICLSHRKARDKMLKIFEGLKRNITAPKGTFEKIFNENDTEDDGI